MVHVSPGRTPDVRNGRRSAWCWAPVAWWARRIKQACWPRSSAKPTGMPGTPTSSWAPPPARSPVPRSGWASRRPTSPPRPTAGRRRRTAGPSSSGSSPTRAHFPSRPSFRSCGPWTPPSRDLIKRTVRRPLAFRPDVATMTLLPRGRIDISGRAQALHAHIGDDWPDGLWICAARRSDGARVVFGRDGSPPDEPGLGRAGVVRHSRATSPRSPSAAPSTSTVACIHGPTPTSSGPQALDTVVVVSSMSATHGRVHRGRQPLALVGAPATRSGDRPSRSSRHVGDPARARPRGRAAPWASGPWPRTARLG